ncbi:MAG: glycoside hydrolase family 2 TIM barrel-domain containing protein [Clostridia bacterium]
MNRIYNFNHDWKFVPYDIEGKNFDAFASDYYKEPQWNKAGNHGLAKTNFDDSNWENVTLPHDAVIEMCDFTADEAASVGSLRKSANWYRKTFTMPKETDDKRIFVRFDGVFRDSQVWVNGSFMGRHLGGYLGFDYELTEVILRNGEPNTIAVFADGTGYEGWWYEGAGIYRDVNIVATPDVRIAENGIFAKPYNFDLEKGTCDLSLEITFDSNKFTSEDCDYTINIVNPKGDTIVAINDKFASEIIGQTTITKEFSVENVMWWDLENTNLYKVIATVTCGGETDEFEQTFGVREYIQDPVNGLRLNGKPLFLKGVCGHDDFAGVGTAMTKAVMKQKIQRLMDMGCNAYRCSHNPPSPVFLELCDEMGMFVMDETRLPGTSREMEEDFINLIKRDRNHPCVNYFSMGNEEMNIQKTQTGINIFTRMETIGNKYDDSREYMFAINCNKIEIVDFLEYNNWHANVRGVNYLTNREEPQFDIIHEHHPKCCFVSTESAGIASVRAFRSDLNDELAPLYESSKNIQVWDNKETEGVLTCYGDYHPKWGISPEQSLKDHADRPYALGTYLWTGFDYRGETSPYIFPQVITGYGIIDLCGFFKDWAYYMKAWWGNEDVLHILPSWNLPLNDGDDVDVWVFSNCDEVELFVNGKSYGKKSIGRYDHLEWKAKYEKGEVLAVGYRNGEKVMEEKQVTSKKEYKLVLSANKTEVLADRDDCVFVTIEVVDEDGKYVTDSCIDVDFSVTGSGIIKGTGNGNPVSHEHDKAPKRKLYAGKALAIVQADFSAEDIEFTATSKDIKSATIKLNTKTLANLDNYIFSTDDAVKGNFRVKELDL